MRMILLFFVFIVCNVGFSQTTLNYSSFTLSDSLKKDADAVYQLEEMEVTVQSASKMKIRSHTVVTILTKNGLKHSTVRIGVDKLYKLEEVKIKVYNDLGIEINKYNKKDFKLEGSFDGISLATDDKVYELDFPVPALPCTIETEYELNCSGFIDIPAWYFGSSTESFKTSRFIVKTAIPVSYKVYNSNIKPQQTKEAEYDVFQWELKTQPVPKKETGSYGSVVTMPWVDVSPSQFDYDSYKGSLSSWKEFGKWAYPFYEETDPFSGERVDFFKNLIKPAKNEKEKIAILYHYLQQETRYVSIQFGIGGHKPFPVAFTEKKKYGDCKGLTHYMKNMLMAVGIKSYAALINAGPNEFPVDPFFASNHFNHVILSVPVQNDTVWLECTGKQTLPGVLGTFTENRNALLLTENGGLLVKTPASNSKNNQWIANSNIKLFEDGSAIIDSRIFVSGEFWDYIHHYTESKSKDEIKKAFVDLFNYKAPDEYEFLLLNDSADGHHFQLKLSYNQLYDFKAGAKQFFPLRHYKLNDETIKPAESRTFDYLFDFPYIKKETTTIQLPVEYKKEGIPATKEIKNDFVLYKNDVQLNETNRELKITTELVLNKHIIPANQYNIVANSFEAIKKDEGQKIILKRE